MNEMYNVGIIADMNYDLSPAFSSYFDACKKIFKKIKIVKNINDLHDVNILLCGNDHFWNHYTIWSDHSFIEYCNSHNIQFFVHTVEHINSPLFPQNLKIQNDLEKYKLLRQRCWDIKDSIQKQTKIARVLLSKNNVNYRKPNEKKDKIVFVGKLYDNRKSIINELSKHIQIDVFERGTTYFEFLSKLAEYKYVFSPKSLHVNGIPGRFYESLWVDSIPIQEVYSDTLDFFDKEKKIKNAIFFEGIPELLSKLNDGHFDSEIIQPKMFLEDELIDFFKDYNIL
jgi:hypothetical protein